MDTLKETSLYYNGCEWCGHEECGCKLGVMNAWRPWRCDCPQTWPGNGEEEKED